VHVERTVAIDRPASHVRPCQWICHDQTVALPQTVILGRITISGPATGVGARMEWDGDPRLSGKGWQKSLEAFHTLVQGNSTSISKVWQRPTSYSSQHDGVQRSPD
jgi:hypothetical protein